MMMLGIVLHASITYIGGDPSFGWPMRDPSADSGFLSWLLSIIHNFRMPIFMMIAGFFAALLFYERSPSRMLRNRFSRLVLPFAVFVILLWPPVILGFSYSNAAFGYDTPFDTVIGTMFINTTVASFAEFRNWIPATTMHLWFVYYLIMFSVASFALGMLFKKLPNTSETIQHQVERLLNSPTKKIVVFVSINFFILNIMGRSWVATSTSFVPDFGTFIFYFYFYLAGWLVFKAKHYLDSFMDHDHLFALLAVVIFTANYLIDSIYQTTEVESLVNSVCVWFFLFGFTGLFIRYFSDHSPRMRYVSDSAYWVYLLHLPLTAVIPGLISDWPLPGVLKFLVVVAGTVSVCFLTYHYFVRTTAIGQFLNGRRYTRNLSDISPTTVAPKDSGLEPASEKAGY
jgi:fucose 4-O-acetylase-like acetyltransferase